RSSETPPSRRVGSESIQAAAASRPWSSGTGQNRAMSASAHAAARNSASLGVAPHGRRAIRPRESGGHGSRNGSAGGASSSAEPFGSVSMASVWLIAADFAGHGGQHAVHEAVRVVGGVALGQLHRLGDAGA